LNPKPHDGHPKADDSDHNGDEWVLREVAGREECDEENRIGCEKSTKAGPEGLVLAGAEVCRNRELI
jgi:hypothetical protein